MPSPFPGMDPFLEGPRWHAFHNMLVNQLAWELSPRLPKEYLALATERVIVEDYDDFLETRNRLPDLSVVEKQATRKRRKQTGAVAVMEPPLRLKTIRPGEHRHLSLEIRLASSKRLITAVELLSPINKRSDGWVDYLEKRNQILSSRTNLVELDFLIRGHRLPTDPPLPEQHYFAVVCRASQRDWSDVWPFSVRDPFPVIPIPLRSDDSDVPLDLGKAFTAVFDHFRYGEILDYSQPLDLPFSAKDLTWIKQRLRSVETARS